MIQVHAVQIDGNIYAVEIDHACDQVVSIFDVKESVFIDDDPVLAEKVIAATKLTPPAGHTQWLHKEASDLLLLTEVEFATWIAQVKLYNNRRNLYCSKKYPDSRMGIFETDVMRDLCPHWTWYLCSQIKIIDGDYVTLRVDGCFHRREAFEEMQRKWKSIIKATAVE